MKRPRGRPSQGKGVSRELILDAALALLEEAGEKSLTMRALAARLGVTPMSLYHHLEDRAELLSELSGQVYTEVLSDSDGPSDHRRQIREILIRYHDLVGKHPQLTLAIFAEPKAFAGMSRRITDRLTELLSAITTEHVLWRDILVDHSHGSGLALAAAFAEPERAQSIRDYYQQALDGLLDRLE